MATVHISSAEAARDFDAILLRIQAGETFVIEKESSPVAVIAAAEPKARLLSEAIATFKQEEAALDEAPTLDPEFADAVRQRIRDRKPHDLSRWA